MKNYFYTILVLFYLLSTSLFSQTQLKYWYQSPKRIDVSQPVPIVTNLVGAQSSLQVNNGMYDNSGNLMFYCSDNSLNGFGSQGIYDRNNTLMANANFTHIITSGGGYASCEISIVPFPDNDNCLKNKYYIFRIGADPANTSRANLIVLVIDMNLNGGLGAAASAETIWDFIDDQNAGGEVGGIAVGKQINGQRFLFYCGGTGPGEIRRINITAAGLSAPTTIYFSNTWETGTQELDLSPDGKHLAWAGWNGTVTFAQRYYKIDVDALGNFVLFSDVAFNVGTAVGNLNIPGGRGVEFDNTSTKLYVGAGNDGIFRVNALALTVGTLAPFSITNTNNYGFSQIELSEKINGQFFVYSSGIGDMVAINSSDVVSTTNNISIPAKKVS